MPLSDGDRAIIAALELLRDRVTQLPLAIAQNAAQAAAEANRPAAPRAAADPPNMLNRGLRTATGAAESLTLAFGRVLGPLAAFGTLLAAPTSGMSVFAKAVGLLGAAVAPVVLPVLFLLATGLAAASDVIFHSLLPALEGFFGFMLSSGMPAVIEFVDTVGRATRALMWLADSKVVKTLAGDSGGGPGGGTFGSLNRTFDRARGEGWGSDGSATGGVKAAHRAVDDVVRLLPGGIGDRTASGLDWARRQFGFDAYGGAGVRRSESGGAVAAAAGAAGVPGGAAGAVGRARSDVLAEMRLAMGPRASTGTIAGVYSRAQMAAFNSPFERRMLEMMERVTTALTRSESDATRSAPGVDTRRPPGGR